MLCAFSKTKLFQFGVIFCFRRFECFFSDLLANELCSWTEPKCTGGKKKVNSPDSLLLVMKCDPKKSIPTRNNCYDALKESDLTPTFNF